MSYTPTNWQAGDTITAEKLNNMENGIENANNPFLVTLTPTAQDYSGTMDKTVAEINEAYESGRKIVFRFMVNSTDYIDALCTTRGPVGGWDYPAFKGYIFTDNPFDCVIVVQAGPDSEPATRDGYFTTIYPLTAYSP